MCGTQRDNRRHRSEQPRDSGQCIQRPRRRPPEVPCLRVGRQGARSLAGISRQLRRGCALPTVQFSQDHSPPSALPCWPPVFRAKPPSSPAADLGVPCLICLISVPCLLAVLLHSTEVLGPYAAQCLAGRQQAIHIPVLHIPSTWCVQTFAHQCASSRQPLPPPSRPSPLQKSFTQVTPLPGKHAPHHTVPCSWDSPRRRGRPYASWHPKTPVQQTAASLVVGKQQELGRGPRPLLPRLRRPQRIHQPLHRGGQLGQPRALAAAHRARLVQSRCPVTIFSFHPITAVTFLLLCRQWVLSPQ